MSKSREPWVTSEEIRTYLPIFPNTLPRSIAAAEDKSGRQARRQARISDDPLSQQVDRGHPQPRPSSRLCFTDLYRPRVDGWRISDANEVPPRLIDVGGIQ